jgi:predicted enzyme related to lactoylglutathione lyase
VQQHEKLDYVEFPASDLEATKRFFTHAFGWRFEDYGPDYVAFSNEGLDGGFYRSDLSVSQDTGSALVIFYSNNLEATEAKIIAAKGTIARAAYVFPGGRRFHFQDPNGNEFAVWSLLSKDGKPFD